MVSLTTSIIRIRPCLRNRVSLRITPDTQMAVTVSVLCLSMSATADIGLVVAMSYGCALKLFAYQWPDDKTCGVITCIDKPRTESVS